MEKNKNCRYSFKNSQSNTIKPIVNDFGQTILPNNKNNNVNEQKTYNLSDAIPKLVQNMVKQMDENDPRVMLLKHLPIVEEKSIIITNNNEYDDDKYIEMNEIITLSSDLENENEDIILLQKCLENIEKLKEEEDNEEEIKSNIKSKFISSNSIKFCNKCNTQLPIKAKFCIECGEQCKDLFKSKYCGNCGNKYDGIEKYCQFCGEKRK